MKQILNLKLKLEDVVRNYHIANYFYNQLKCEAVTYEEGYEIDRAIIKALAKVYANQLMKTMLLNDQKL